MKRNILLLSLFPSCILAADCGGCGNNRDPRSCSDVHNVLETLCAGNCAAGGDYTYTITGEYGDQAQYTMQPNTCPTNCRSAVNDIVDQCLIKGCKTGTWSYGASGIGSMLLCRMDRLATDTIAVFETLVMLLLST
ncbi:hypothetical protein MMC12_004675 [Toensbergia leucococca]|nr:hypothetical protein [Toensbergia leucococca]